MAAPLLIGMFKSFNNFESLAIVFVSFITKQSISHKMVKGATFKSSLIRVLSTTDTKQLKMQVSPWRQHWRSGPHWIHQELPRTKIGKLPKDDDATRHLH